jgi:hypothetical protein
MEVLLHYVVIWSSQPFGIFCGFYGHEVYFSVLVSCIKKNLAILVPTTAKKFNYIHKRQFYDSVYMKRNLLTKIEMKFYVGRAYIVRFDAFKIMDFGLGRQD